MKEYLTLDEAAASVGLKRPSLYYYLKKLEIKREHFKNNRHIWISSADVERIRAVREKPWTVDEDDTDKREAVKDAA
jgi:hypothetical protein